MEREIINRVASSPLITIELDDFYEPGERVEIDLKDNLENEFLLREKDFRQFVKDHDWNSYSDKFVAVHCSADAIIPNWAYMLVASKLSGISNKIVFGDLNDLEEKLFLDNISKLNPDDYLDKKIVIKGCGKIETPPAAFLEITRLLKPFVSSLMYGEPCSTVPVYKKTKS